MRSNAKEFVYDTSCRVPDIDTFATFFRAISGIRRELKSASATPIKDIGI
jgi:hypothetical protein